MEIAMVFLVAAAALMIALFLGAFIAPAPGNHDTSGSPLRALETEDWRRRAGGWPARGRAT
jgi:hypothetical protein